MDQVSEDQIDKTAIDAIQSGAAQADVDCRQLSTHRKCARPKTSRSVIAFRL